MKIVAAIDTEESAKSALDYIVKEKYPPDTQIHLVHVMVPGFAEAHVEGIPDVVEEEETKEKKILNEMVRSIKLLLDIDATAKIIPGETATVIAEECKTFGADEAIVPSHARHGFARLWFGSVADEIVDAAPCTVVVLKMPADKSASKT
jgi:nucleotide-binding universal stress UspA family protein